MIQENSDSHPELQRDSQPSAPIDENGAEAGRDRRGRFTTGNTAALVSGARSQAFWAGVEGQRRALVARTLEAKGTTPADASPPLLAAADGLAKALLLRESEWERVKQTGGQRGAVKAWEAADGRVE